MAQPETKYDALAEAVRDLQRAARDSLKWAERRAALPLGSSRARVTTANARWAQAAEERDRCEKRVAEILRGLPHLLPDREVK